ncbi:hypothetical protein L1987_33959 [Smallanthus sonchifolius]|uniref:Uncharacterized protein n=1 Tax=Smallanthus sonchifolius TaxID=185202 RepID=A0ACB9HT73_9ASTR|nr:hypothetical protein L1987_33959 [Smallanthus sonchifolius]
MFDSFSSRRWTVLRNTLDIDQSLFDSATRTHCRSSISEIYLSRAPPLSPASFSPSRSPIVDASNQFYALCYPRRKKLMAARSMFYSEPSDGPVPVIDAFTNDFLVAH